MSTELQKQIRTLLQQQPVFAQNVTSDSTHYQGNVIELTDLIEKVVTQVCEQREKNTTGMTVEQFYRTHWKGTRLQPNVVTRFGNSSDESAYAIAFAEAYTKQRAEAAELALQEMTKERDKFEEFNRVHGKLWKEDAERFKASLQAKELELAALVETLKASLHARDRIMEAWAKQSDEDHQAELARARQPLLQLGRECAVAISGDHDDATDIGEDAELAVRAINAALKMGRAGRQQAIAECAEVAEEMGGVGGLTDELSTAIARAIRSLTPPTSKTKDEHTVDLLSNHDIR